MFVIFFYTYQGYKIATNVKKIRIEKKNFFLLDTSKGFFEAKLCILDGQIKIYILGHIKILLLNYALVIFSHPKPKKDFWTFKMVFRLYSFQI